MLSQPVDVHIAARVFLDQHGRESAIAVCESNEDERYEAGDLLGVAAWRGIRSAIFRLTSRPGSPVQP